MGMDQRIISQRRHPNESQQTSSSMEASISSSEENTKQQHSYHDDATSKTSQIELKIPFRSLAVTTATAQISSLVFCLAWSVKFNFFESTATHCRVDNYLPSLSATLDFTPQRDIWRTCIGLSGLPRYFIAYLYYQLIFKSKPLLWLHWIEITALIGLSIVDSIRYFGEYSWDERKPNQLIVQMNQPKFPPITTMHHSTAFHATCVGIFLMTSIVQMTLVSTNYIRPSARGLSETTRQTLKTTQIVKRRYAILNFLTIVIALYLYDRHNRYCEPGVYSMFSFLEYIVIVLNITYHLEAYYDLGEYSILVAKFDNIAMEPKLERDHL